MAPAKPHAEKKRRYFTVEEANKALPLVRMIVGDIVRQYRVVEDLQQRLSVVAKERRRPSNDFYSEELAQSQAELDAEESKLSNLHRRIATPRRRVQGRRRALRLLQHHGWSRGVSLLEARRAGGAVLARPGRRLRRTPTGAEPGRLVPGHASALTPGRTVAGAAARASPSRSRYALPLGDGRSRRRVRYNLMAQPPEPSRSAGPWCGYTRGGRPGAETACDVW